MYNIIQIAKKIKKIYFLHLFLIAMLLLQASEDSINQNDIPPKNISLHISKNNQPINNQADKPNVNLEDRAQEVSDYIRNEVVLRKRKKKKWCARTKACFLFWRKSEYLNSYPALIYKSSFGQQLTDLSKDIISFVTHRGELTDLSLQPGDNEKIVLRKLTRNATRKNCYPLITRTCFLSLIIFIYGLVNIFRDSDKKIDTILGRDFRICRNPFLDKVVKEVPSYDQPLTNTYTLQNISDFFGDLKSLFSEQVDKYEIDFTLLEEAGVPSSTYLNLLNESVDAYGQAINETHQTGYDPNVYSFYWPNPITNDDIQSSINSNFSSSYNITTTERSFVANDTTVTYSSNTVTLCYPREKLKGIAKFGAWLAREKEVCLPYTYQTVLTNTNQNITVESVTNITSTENNFYETYIDATLESLGIDIPDISTVSITLPDFQNIADKVSEGTIEKFKYLMTQFLRRAKFASDLYAFFVPIVIMLITPGYEISKMGIVLRLRTFIGNITKIRWIGSVVAIWYIVQLLPFGWPEIWLVIRNPKFFINLMFKLTINICHFNSPKEVAIAYAVSERVALQENIKQKISTSLSFVQNDQAIENTYRNFSELEYQNIYGHLANDTNYYRGLLSGAIFPSEFFTYFPGKVVCDPSLLSTTYSPSSAPTDFPTFSPIPGMPNTTNLFNNIGGVSATDCGTIFDTNYAIIVGQEIRNHYIIDISTAWLPLLLYSVSTVIVIRFILNLSALFCPLAMYRGRMIGSKGLLVDDPSDLAKGKQPKYVKVANHIRFTSMLPFLVSCFFFTLVVVFGAV